MPLSSPNSIRLNQLKIYDMPEKLVFLLNATADEERGFSEEVGMRMKIVGYDLPEATRFVELFRPRLVPKKLSDPECSRARQSRQKMYKDGGLFSVSSTILITDMLKGSVPVDLITGLVVMHAET